MKTETLIACLCLLGLCTGCSNRPTVRKISAASLVVAFGDSLTSGAGADKAENYPSLLSQIPTCKVINAGRSGEDSSEGLRRLPGVLKQYEPDLVILCHGGNDMLNGQDQNTIINNLNAMIVLIKEAHSDVILVGVPKPGLLVQTPLFYQEIANEYRIPFESDALSAIMSSPELKSDYIHPNAKGYRSLAQAIAALIRVSERK